MKKLFLTSAMATLMMFSGMTESRAVMFTDLDLIAQELTAAGPQSTYSGTFNIVDDGFIPGTHNVWAAGITFSLIDDLDTPTETFTINLDGTYGSSQYTSFLVLGVNQVGIDLLASINADGILNYSITATSGDFWLMSALLFAEATTLAPETRAVPDNGSTLILAAIGLVALILIERRLVKRA